jgi:hypothetical protein
MSFENEKLVRSGPEQHSDFANSKTEFMRVWQQPSDIQRRAFIFDRSVYRVFHSFTQLLWQSLNKIICLTADSERTSAAL